MLEQIRKDTSNVEHQLNLQQSATSGCINRNGHLCIGLCIIVILYYLLLNYHHFLSLALISIFYILIFITSSYQCFNSFFVYIKLNRTPSCYEKNEVIQCNSSDNNFYCRITDIETCTRNKNITNSHFNSLVSTTLPIFPL